MKILKTLLVVLCAALALSSCNGKKEDAKKPSAVDKVKAAKEAIANAKPVAEPTGDIDKDCKLLVDMITDKEKGQMPETQATFNSFKDYYKKQGKDKEFGAKITQCTLDKAIKDKAAKDKAQKSDEKASASKAK